MMVVHADRLKPCFGITAADLNFKQFGPPRPGSPQGPRIADTRPSSPPVELDVEPEMEADRGSEVSEEELEDWTHPQSPVRTRTGRKVTKPAYLKDYWC